MRKRESVKFPWTGRNGSGLKNQMKRLSFSVSWTLTLLDLGGVPEFGGVLSLLFLETSSGHAGQKAPSPDVLPIKHIIFAQNIFAKNLPGNAGDARDRGSIPGLGRFLGEGNGTPLQYSCLGNSMDRGAWWATYSLWGCRSRRNWAQQHNTIPLLRTAGSSSSAHIFPVTQKTAFGVRLCFDFHCERFSAPSLFLPVFLVLQAQDYSKWVRFLLSPLRPHPTSPKDAHQAGLTGSRVVHPRGRTGQSDTLSTQHGYLRALFHFLGVKSIEYLVTILVRSQKTEHLMTPPPWASIFSSEKQS